MKEHRLLPIPLLLGVPLLVGACLPEGGEEDEEAVGVVEGEVRDASGNEVITAIRDTWLKVSEADSTTLPATSKCQIKKGERVKLKALEDAGNHASGRLMSAHGCGGRFSGGSIVYLFRAHFSGWTIPAEAPDVTIVDQPSNYAASCQYRPASRTAANVGTIVLHNTLGAWESFKGAWQSCGRIGAAHFVVRRDGTILRTIPEKNIAYHAAGANSESIGVEIETGPHDEVIKPPAQGMTPIQERRVIALTKSLQRRWGVTKSNITMHRIAPGAASTSCASNVWGWQSKGGDQTFRVWRDRVF